MQDESQPKEFNTSIGKINNILKSNKQVHKMLSKFYYLPPLSSRAINKEYLMYYSMILIPIFSIALANTKIAWAEDCRKSAEELLKVLEGILIEQKLPPTGLDIDTLPNLEWLFNVIHTLDPQDLHKTFNQTIPLEQTLTRSLNLM